MIPSSADVTILGGGLSGLALALQVRQRLPKAEIVILEKRTHPAPEAAFKVGESTVEVAAHYFGTVLGMRDHIREEQLPKLGLRFFFPSGDNSRIEDRLELGGRRFAPCPSYQLDRGRFENHLAERCLAEGVRFVDRATVKDFSLRGFGKRHEAQFEREGQQHSLTTRWLIDASGRRAFIKRKLGLAMPSPHRANAAWFRFSEHLRIDDWCDDPDWGAGHEGPTGRWYSTNHLMGQGYWVWMIPLASGSTSMGIVASEEHHPLTTINSLEKAIAWLEKHEPQCAEVVKANRDKLQDFKAIKRYAVECKQVFSPRRWGITGEAGFFHDPFYSPGSDFIAFSNTFLTDLIQRDSEGKDFRIRAFAYDRIFKRFYYGTATAYYDQYGLFGNPTVMPVKILWDYMVYWSITAFIFMQGRMCEQRMYLKNLGNLKRLGALNHAVQELFRTWHQATEGRGVSGRIDISSMPIIRQSNQRLLDDLDRGAFNRRFQDNLAQLEQLAAEISEQSGVKLAVSSRRGHADNVMVDSFQHPFNPTKVIPSERMIVA